MTIPNGILGYFKPRMLYLIAAMYSTGHYEDINDSHYRTDVTIKQLSSISGDTLCYIEESLYPQIRKSNNVFIKWDGNYFSHQVTEKGYIARRNIFSLLKPTENFRIIRSGIFQDNRFTPDEKGYIIALYMLCINNTFRFELSDTAIAKSIGVSLNTWKKYKNVLVEKGVIQKFKNAPAGLLDPNFGNAMVLNYEYLGYKSASIIQEEALQDINYISDITYMQSMIMDAE